MVYFFLICKAFHQWELSNFNWYVPLKTSSQDEWLFILALKSTLIYPASEKHIEKYRRQESHLIRETAEDYEHITRPYIESTQFSTQWVYNILEKKTESERIICEDADEKTGVILTRRCLIWCSCSSHHKTLLDIRFPGFILLPDLKWDGKQIENLYLVAIIHRRDVKSLRELRSEHLPLLRNILQKGIVRTE